MQQKTFTVPSIGCDGCVRTIKDEIDQIAGVQWVAGDVNTKAVTIAWDDPTLWDTIKQRLASIDYAPEEA